MAVRVYKPDRTQNVRSDISQTDLPSGVFHLSSVAPPRDRMRAQVEPDAKRVLNAGSGAQASHRLHAIFRTGSWAETTLDVDPRHNPDIVCSIANMRSAIAAESFDALWSSHNIEHLHAHEVPVALAEFERVLRPNGFALIRCPNLEAIARKILADGPDCVAYTAPAGPITPLDMLYGYSSAVARGDAYMRHHTGFTVATLAKHLMNAGFDTVHMLETPDFDLWALASKGTGPARGLLQELALHGQRFES